MLEGRFCTLTHQINKQWHSSLQITLVPSIALRKKRSFTHKNTQSYWREMVWRVREGDIPPTKQTKSIKKLTTCFRVKSNLRQPWLEWLQIIPPRIRFYLYFYIFLYNIQGCPLSAKGLIHNSQLSLCCRYSYHTLTPKHCHQRKCLMKKHFFSFCCSQKIEVKGRKISGEQTILFFSLLLILLHQLFGVFSGKFRREKSISRTHKNEEATYYITSTSLPLQLFQYNWPILKCHS